MTIWLKAGMEMIPLADPELPVELVDMAFEWRRRELDLFSAAWIGSRL